MTDDSFTVDLNFKLNLIQFNLNGECANLCTFWHVIEINELEDIFRVFVFSYQRTNPFDAKLRKFAFFPLFI